MGSDGKEISKPLLGHPFFSTGDRKATPKIIFRGD